MLWINCRKNVLIVILNESTSLSPREMLIVGRIPKQKVLHEEKIIFYSLIKYLMKIDWNLQKVRSDNWLLILHLHLLIVAIFMFINFFLYTGIYIFILRWNHWDSSQSWWISVNIWVELIFRRKSEKKENKTLIDWHYFWWEGYTQELNVCKLLRS